MAEKRQFSWDSVTAIAAVVIAGCSMYIAYQNSQETRLSNELAAAPYVALGTALNADGFQLSASNLGNGIAIAKWFGVALDGKLVDSWDDVFGALGLKFGDSFSIVYPETVLPVGQTEILLKNGENSRQLWAASDRLSFGLCYCSTYGKCTKKVSGKDVFPNCDSETTYQAIFHTPPSFMKVDG